MPGDKYNPPVFPGEGIVGVKESMVSASVPSSSTRESHRYINHGKTLCESMDFEEMESIMWRKHQLRRFFQDRGQWWTSSRRTTAWKWVLVVVTGFIIGLVGFGVSSFTQYLSDKKFSYSSQLIDDNNWTGSFFTYVSFCLVYSFVAGIMCWIEPAAAGSGIPEIKAYLNGINLNKVVRIRVLFAKVLGMCFSVSSGLPLGKEGPMIHSGSIVGAAVSQGKTITFGFDTSWTKFQDLRNDRSKRDFVTFGAAAGVAAAFNAPIGGILFTLEEGASFWSTSLTFRAFFCGLVTMLTLNICTQGVHLTSRRDALFAFGTFDDVTGYNTYELFIFAGMGVAGGIMGAFFNEINKRVSKFRASYANQVWKRMIELLILTFVFSVITFVVPLMWNTCTEKPTDTADWSTSQLDLLDELVQYECGSYQYNQVASLYFVPSDVAMQQLYHYKEIDGTTYTTFNTGPLLLFFVPYFLMAAVTSGTLCPAGLFVPTLLAGAAYGRIVGHILNCLCPGFVTDSGSYALIGAAAILGGMSRMTIAGTIIILEACGNSTYLLPLMVTFAAARYTGNAINAPMYDMHIELKELPFLEGSLRTLGLLNYHPVVELMAQPVVTFNEINKVSAVHQILSTKPHNGFPIVDKNGHLKGFILRKTLCSILKLKAFSTSTTVVNQNGETVVQLSTPAAVFHDTLERNYPHYPKIEDISLSPSDMNCWLDVRPYMDSAPYSINASSSIQRCYRFFRTMGLRHLVVLDNDHRVCGIITRKDITEHRLEHHWFQEGDNMQKFMSVDPMEPGQVVEGLLGNEDMPQDSIFTTPDDIATAKRFGTMEMQDGAAPSISSTSSFFTGITSQPITSSSGSRTRDHRAMKEPKSIKK